MDTEITIFLPWTQKAHPFENSPHPKHAIRAQNNIKIDIIPYTYIFKPITTMDTSIMSW